MRKEGELITSNAWGRTYFNSVQCSQEKGNRNRDWNTLPVSTVFKGKQLTKTETEKRTVLIDKCIILHTFTQSVDHLLIIIHQIQLQVKRVCAMSVCVVCVCMCVHLCV